MYQRFNYGKLNLKWNLVAWFNLNKWEKNNICFTLCFQPNKDPETWINQSQLAVYSYKIGQALRLYHPFYCMGQKVETQKINKKKI